MRIYNATVYMSTVIVYNVIAFVKIVMRFNKL